MIKFIKEYMFLNELAIDLSIFLFESDQGKAFVSFSNHNNIENIVCIRHFLSNLKREKNNKMILDFKLVLLLNVVVK